MSTVKAIELAENFSARNYKPLPVALTTGEGAWVTDTEGKRYLDCLSAYSAVNQGHRHPRILGAMRQQMERICLTSRAFHNDVMGEFAQYLCQLSGFQKMLPMNTGAEAVETSIKMSRRWAYRNKGIEPDKAEIIVCDGNFHGRTTTVISFSSEDAYRDGFGPFTPGFKIVPYGDAKQMEAAIGPNTAAILVEPIQGEAGVVVPPKGYLADLRWICSSKNVLLMFDEIQVGLGRTGKMFCFEHEKARPDVLILGKAISGGMYPVSAALADEEVMGVFGPGDHGSTYGGNPLGMAVALEALKVIVEEKMPERAEALGEKLLSGLEKIRTPEVKEIRGRGLMVGIQLIPEVGGARKYCERLMELGILCKDTHRDVIRIAPPLVITEEEVDVILDSLKTVFDEFRRG